MLFHRFVLGTLACIVSGVGAEEQKITASGASIAAHSSEFWIDKLTVFFAKSCWIFFDPNLMRCYGEKKTVFFLLRSRAEQSRAELPTDSVLCAMKHGQDWVKLSFKSAS